MYLGLGSPRSWCTLDVSLYMEQNTSCETDTWWPIRKKPNSQQCHRPRPKTPSTRDGSSAADDARTKRVQSKREWETFPAPAQESGRSGGTILYSVVCHQRVCYDWGIDYSFLAKNSSHRAPQPRNFPIYHTPITSIYHI